MANYFRINVLTLIGKRKNYTVKFHNGLNYISGHTSTGKTSILELIDYALGAKSHKSYIEIGQSCSEIEIEISIGDSRIKVKRPLFDFKSPVIVEEWNNGTGHQKCRENGHANT